MTHDAQADLTVLVPDDQEVQELCTWAQYEGWSAQRLDEVLRGTRWYQSRVKAIEDWWDDTGGRVPFRG